jgi:ribosomal protein S17
MVSIRGRILTGKVVSTKMHRTLIIRREYLHFVPKYARYEKRHSNLAAHVSPAFRVEDGDTVTVGQCRPLSKTVSRPPYYKFSWKESAQISISMPKVNGINWLIGLFAGTIQCHQSATEDGQGREAIQQVLSVERLLKGQQGKGKNRHHGSDA